MKQLIVTFFLFSVFAYSHAQEKECLVDFNYIVNRIKNDYPGYSDKVNQENIADLKGFETKIRNKITLYPDSCFIFLNDYTSWFKDHHLRISHNRDYSKNDGNGSHDRKYTTTDLESVLAKSNTLEGVWVGYWGTFVVEKRDDKYLGVAINFSGYEQNQIIFEAIDKGSNEFELITYRDYLQYRPQQEKASLLLNKSVFEIHDDTRFVRQTSDKKADMAFLTSYIPKYPNGSNTYPIAMSLTDSTFYLRIPSFYSDLANDFVEKYWNEIMMRPNLIIDIRNNGGGQDNYYQKLAELIYTNPYESKGVEWYATKGIIEDWEDAIKNGLIKDGYEEESKALVEKMKENIGGFVIHPYHKGNDMVKRDTIYKYPKQVGVIINGRNASSAEQFILTAKNSSKVILFGTENTAGVLDYSNITPKELPSGEYNLWLPATRSRRLPENPIDNIGIAPDINIPFKPTLQLFDRLDDWVYFVKNYLEYKE